MERRIGRYQVLEEISSGGQATVYRVWDIHTGQILALKVMHPHLSRDAAYQKRFHREAQMASSLDHPNIIRIFEVGQDGDSHFIAMEYLPLGLHDLIKAQGRLPVERAAEIVYQVCLALEAARKRGIVHRDIKPQNILIGPEGTVKLADFGIARAQNLSAMTHTGMVMGTPHYMSPEQAQGQQSDTRSDLYSLGIVMYQILAGQLPFEGDTPWEVIRKQVEDKPAPVGQVRPEVPRKLASVVERCLKKEPGRRCQNPMELAQAIEDAMPKAMSVPKQTPVNDTPPTSPPPPREPSVQPKPSLPSSILSLLRHRVGGHAPRWGWMFSVGVSVGLLLAVLFPGGGLAGILDILRPEATDPPTSAAGPRGVPSPRNALKEERLFRRAMVVMNNLESFRMEGSIEGWDSENTFKMVLKGAKSGEALHYVQRTSQSDAWNGYEEVIRLPPYEYRRDSEEGRWYRLSLEEAKYRGIPPPLMTGIIIFPHTDIPLRFYELTPLGTEVIDGVRANRLSVRGDWPGIMNWLEAEDKLSEVAARSTNGDLEQFRGEYDLTPIDQLEVWIDEDGFLRRMTVKFNQNDYLTGGAFRFFAFNQPISLQPPTRFEIDTPSDLTQLTGLDTFPVDGDPHALAFDGEAIWVANHQEGTVVRLTLDGRELGTFLKGGDPHDLVFDGEAIWVAVGGGGNVTKLALDGRVLGVFGVGGVPSVLAFDGDTIWVRNEVDDMMTRLSLDGEQLGTFPVGSGPGGLVFDGEAMWVALPGDQKVMKLSRSGEVLGAFPVAVSDSSHGLAFDGESIWVAMQEDNMVTRLSLDGTQLGTIQVGENPVALAFDEKSIWVASSADNTVTRFTLDGRKLGTFQVGEAPVALAFDGKAIWVANSKDNSVTALATGVEPPVTTAFFDCLVALFGEKRAKEIYRIGAELPLKSLQLIRSECGESEVPKDLLPHNVPDKPALSPSIPTPELVLKGVEPSETNGNQFMRYLLSVANWADFPEELFESAPDLPPCGLNPNASRTWVEIYDAKDSSYIYGFCRFSSPDWLQKIWFSVEQGTSPPEAVYVSLKDRKANSNYRSNVVYVPKGVTITPAPTPTGLVSIGLRLGATISGRVVDVATGLPIANVDIEAAPIDEGGSYSYTQTGPDGGYTLRGLAPGTYRIKTGWEKQGYIETFYNSKLSWDAADLITIEARDSVKGIDLGLKLGVTISGRVVDAETGLPIAEVEIEADPFRGEGAQAYAKTDSDGRYTLRGVAPGFYRIKAGWNEQGYVQKFYNNKVRWEDADLITVRGTKAVEGIDFGLKLGATISGKVFDEETGLPIPGVDINAESAYEDGLYSYANTDSLGRYTLRGVAPGTYRIKAGWNERGYIQEFYQDKSSWDAADLVTIKGGESFEGLDFALGLGATISGKVVDTETGLPIADVKIEADPFHGEGAQAYARTDADGRYTLRGVAPGFYRIKVGWNEQGYVQEFYHDKFSWDAADPVTIKERESLEGIDFGLKLGATISGRVVDVDTGLSLADLEVSAGPVGGDHLAWTRTDSNGYYILKGLPDGVIEIIIRGHGYIEERITAIIRDGVEVTGNLIEYKDTSNLLAIDGP